MGNSWETFPCLTRDLLMPQDCHSLTEIPQRLHNVWCMKMPIRLPSGFFFPVRLHMAQRGYRLQHSPFQKSFLIPVIQKTQGTAGIVPDTRVLILHP